MNKKTKCWEDWHSTLTEEEELENIMEMSKTCLLEAGHKGPHEWTNDDEFGVVFNKESKND